MTLQGTISTLFAVAMLGIALTPAALLLWPPQSTRTVERAAASAVLEGERGATQASCTGKVVCNYR